MIFRKLKVAQLPCAVFLFLQNNIKLATGILILYAVVSIVRNFIEPKIIGKQIGIKYEDTGVFIIPQSKNIKKMDEEQKTKFIKSIQNKKINQHTKQYN